MGSTAGSRIRGIVGMAAVVAVLAVGLGVFASAVTGEPQDYYTRVDNARVSETPEGTDMPYQYTLDAYTANGDRRSFTFKTSKILRDEAYLCLEVLPLRGVVSWSEVERDWLPSAALDALG